MPGMKQSTFASEPATGRLNRETVWLIVLWLATGLNFLLSPIGAQVRNPNPPVGSWEVAAEFSFGLICMSLWRSWAAKTRLGRWGAGVAIVLALPSLANPLLSYYTTFSDFPWLVLVPASLALVAGAWLGRQYWLIALIGAPAVYVFVCAQWPAKTALPVSQTKDGVKLTVQQLERDQNVVFCSLDIASDNGKRFGYRRGPTPITIDGEAAGMPYRTWPPGVFPPADFPSNDIELTAYTFPPRWARCVDLMVTVPAQAGLAGKTLVFHFDRLPNPSGDHQSIGLPIATSG